MTPILYSFRRCPYAMRARLAVAVAGVEVDLREILLRDKPVAFLAASPSGTVPCLVTQAGVIDESLEIMIWALRQNDPDGWLDMPQAGHDWIARGDGPFKAALDRVKYASRHPAPDVAAAQAEAVRFFNDLEAQLGNWVFDRASLADYALLPFVRQFAFVDKHWFDNSDYSQLQRWLQGFLESPLFIQCMDKLPPWQPEDQPRLFP